MRRFLLVVMLAGCARIFGWNIHAPALMSESYFSKIEPASGRVALYIPDSVMTYESGNRGGRFADPQTYYVGEAMTPMLIEAFQHAFDEFVLMETEPDRDILTRYAIPYLVVVDIDDFYNRVTLKGQAVALDTTVQVFDTQMNPVARFEATGASDAQKVFAKKGGPEVNLNAAVENNIAAIVEYLQSEFGRRRPNS